jgi:hypothetical protein
MLQDDLHALESTSRLALHHFVFASALEMAEPAPMMRCRLAPRRTGPGNLAERRGAAPLLLLTPETPRDTNMCRACRRDQDSVALDMGGDNVQADLVQVAGARRTNLWKGMAAM